MAKAKVAAMPADDLTAVLDTVEAPAPASVDPAPPAAEEATITLAVPAAPPSVNVTIADVTIAPSTIIPVTERTLMEMDAGKAALARWAAVAAAQG
jgi:hypothetical protein